MKLWGVILSARTRLIARTVSMLLSGLVLAGCGLLSEKAHISGRFESIHSCPAETVSYVGGNNYMGVALSERWFSHVNSRPPIWERMRIAICDAA